MKRILTWMLLLVLVVGLFAGCKDSKDAPKATEPTAATEEYVSAQAAMEYLKAIYKRSEEALATPRDYERYAIPSPLPGITQFPRPLMWLRC